MADLVSEFTEARTDILHRIATASKAVGRSAVDVALVAVAKRQPEERVAAALAAGHRIFGENRVQEAQDRWAARRADVINLELRMIGALQSNKALEAVRLFDVIETLDRPKLAHALKDAIEKASRAPRLYVQVNTGEEAQKSGVRPAEVRGFVGDMRDRFGFEIEGLMCIPPLEEEPALHFALLAELAAEAGVEKLSMGMSGDFETAVRHGATSVRVGTALFGARET